MCWSSFTLPSSSGLATNISPKVRGSTNRRSPPCWNVTITWVCGASATRPFARRNCPLIPKCTTQTSPPSRVSNTYLPRRSVFVTLCPTSRDVKSLRVLCRRTTRSACFDPLTSTSLIFLPTTSRSRSRRITSTSGSSMPVPFRAFGSALGPALGPGLGSGLDRSSRDQRMRLARGLLLRLLLGSSDPAAQRLARDHDRRRELLLVVGTPLLDVIHGERAELLGGELLQDRLVVAVPLPSHVCLHPRREQPLDQRAGDVETEVQIDRTENRLEGVGQDARLVSAARPLFPLAEQHDGGQVELPCYVRERGPVDDRRAELRELPLGHLGVGPVGEVGDDQPEDRVAQELQTLVRDGQIVLERERSVGQRGLAQLRVAERHPERAVEGLEPGFDRRLAHALLDLDRLSTGVVPAVPAHTMRQFGVLALRACAVGGCGGLPRRSALRGSHLALLLLRNGHARVSSISVGVG